MGAAAQWTPVAEDTSAWKPVAEDHTSPGFLDSMGNYARGVWDELKSTGAGLAQAAQHPLDTLKGMGSAQDALRQKAADAAKQGDYVSAARHAIDYILPIVGPALDSMGDEAQAGQVAHALGRATTLGLMTAGPAALGSPGGIEAATKIGNVVSAAAKAGVPKIAGGGAMIAGGEALAAVPGMEWPARIGMGYPGARMIAGGLKEGFQAGRAAATAPSEIENIAAGMARASAAEVENLDKISMQTVGKPFAEATELQQNAFRAALEHESSGPAPKATTIEPSGQAATPYTPQPAGPRMMPEDRLEQELAARRPAPTTVPTGPGVQAGPPPAPPQTTQITTEPVTGTLPPPGVSAGPLRPPGFTASPVAPAPAPTGGATLPPAPPPVETPTQGPIAPTASQAPPEGDFEALLRQSVENAKAAKTRSLAQTEAAMVQKQPLTPPASPRPYVEEGTSTPKMVGRGFDIENINRANKVDRFAKALSDIGLGPSDVKRIPEGWMSDTQIRAGAVPGWGNIADFLGEKPPSDLTVGDIMQALKKGK